MCKELSNIKYVLFDSSIIFAGSENMDLFSLFPWVITETVIPL